ncbi:MAG: hypothetical protein SVY10_12970 [Thermodesulfobacteriota bacterium]|nr:hypothetical protein [Thermodesulfobacteriota bacterium]
MEPIRFVQTWDPIAGRKQEYATFITGEFQPGMKALGLEVVSGWYTLVGGGPHILVESLAESFNQVEKALHDERLHEMLGRFMNLVTHYASRVLEPTGWVTRYHGQMPSPEGVKYVQLWDIQPRQQEACDRFIREVHLPQMEAIGLKVIAGWNLMVGSGPQLLSEALAPNLARVAEALSDERYLQLITRMEELVTHYESRVLVQHRSFLDTLQIIHGRAIRAVAPDEMVPMVGPIVE